ncbi:MAG: enolase C-terminal domain-like protein [Chloroflexota bacterium]|nr:enolase C-terminal domain-like protein [Chloroflexota bacterium]
MKITGLTVHIFQPRPDVGQEVKEWQNSPTHQNGVAVIHTDQGIDGVVATGAGQARQLANLWKIAREHIEGQDPLDRGKIEDILIRRFYWPMQVRGILDHGLWDIAGKLFNLPVYRLLGQTREKVLAYGSTVHHDTDEKFVETCLACKAHGFKAIKLHPYCVADLDIPLAYKCRKAVGDDMVFMMDSLIYPGHYTREEAMRVGRALDELNFWWFEDPIEKRDLDGLAWLTRELKVNIRAADRVEDPHEYSYMIANKCMDIMAGPMNTGITELIKLSALAEMNFLGFEPHDYSGGTASLHFLLASTVAKYYEKAVPLGRWYESSYPGVYLDPVQVDKEGYVHGPKKPGLGFEVDWKEAKKVTEQVFNA